MTKNPRDIVLRPVVSEKSYALYDENVYTFLVAPDSNKIEIKNAVESIFSVKVIPACMRFNSARMGMTW